MSYRIALPLLLVKLLHAVPLIFEQAQHDWSQVEATQRKFKPDLSASSLNLSIWAI